MATPIPQVFGIQWGGGRVNSQATVNGALAIALDETLASGTTTNAEFDLTIPDDTSLLGLTVIVTGNALAPVVLTTNNSGSPVQTFTFPVGGGRFTWDSTFPAELDCPITTAVTKLFISHTGAETPRIQINGSYNGV